jgi:hypothetical protein
MSEARNAAVAAVTDHLMPTEDHVDAALSGCSDLFAAMMRAAQHVGASRAEAQTALAPAAEAQALLMDVRRALIRSHKALADIGRNHGVEPQGYGAYYDCPEMDPQTSRGHLTAVAA